MIASQQLLFYLTCFVLAESKTTSNNDRYEARKIPDEMLFGASTAAYQIEGAWNADGKSESIWDRMSHQKPCVIQNCDTGDVAANSYYLYKRDVEMIRELGLNFYRFSLSWTRILPSGFPDKLNEKGVQYYNNLIDELLKYNIQPMVTLYHWDLPQKLQELGGWANPHIVDWFTDYSKIAFELFGDRVKYWLTINEPRQICNDVDAYGYANYLCYKYVLLAHAKVYHMYHDSYKSRHNGVIGLVISATWHEPVTEQDADAAEDINQFEWGAYANPIFSKKGDFPQVMKEKIAAKSLAQGFPRSRLPEFTPEEVEFIKGSSDFFGLNHYTTSMVYRNESVYGYHPSPSFYDDIDVIYYSDNSWEGSPVTFWMKSVPWGFYKLLTKIRADYDNPPVFITENGFSTLKGLNDDLRVSYYRGYINAMLNAIDEGSDIRLYSTWSLMDNFEWQSGYGDRFGLYEVDFDSPNRTRTPRKSAYVYKQIARTRTLDFDYEPDMSVPLTIDEGY